MALFDGAKRVPGSRSHSRLVVSEGFSPAERWVTDPKLKPLFEYHYGGPGFVVIPKGTIVGVGDHVKDYETGNMVNVLTIAGGDVKPCGVAPYNIYQRVEGRLYHNQPALITRDYIEVPLMVDAESVFGQVTPRIDPNNPMKWGCAYGALKAGDYVGTDAAGKFVNLDSPDAKFTQIVGQVLAVETDMPPTGWLKWLDWANDSGERTDDNNVKPYPTDPDGGRPYSPDYKWPLTPDYRGIPGMTDGGQMGLEDVTDEFNGVDGFALEAPAGTTKVFKLSKLPVQGEPITVTINEVAVETFKVDYAASYVYVTTPDAVGAVAGDGDVAISYSWHDLTKLGVPAAWDFKGSLGAVRILLKF